MLYINFSFLVLEKLKQTFERRHELMSKNMEELKVSLAEVKSDLKILVELLKILRVNEIKFKTRKIPLHVKSFRCI